MVRRIFPYVNKKTGNVQDLWHYYWRNFAVDTGAIDGHVNYTKFLILGRSRTGSNFLRGLLNSHNQILTYGEIFWSYDAIGWGYRYYPQTRGLRSLIQNDPIRFLETIIFRNLPTYISAVGFKMFYYHAQNDKWKSVWTYLRNQEDMRVIHLKRRNILKTHLSRKRAGLTDLWVSNPLDSAKYNEPVFLSYDECLEAFTDTRDWERQYDALFEGHCKIDVLYEKLASDYINETRRIQEFLGVDYEVVKPTTHKQSSQPLSRAILNYFELKERFEGTPWEEFFQD